MRRKHPWRWAFGIVVAVLLSAAAFAYYRVNEALRGDYETILVIQLVEDYVKMHHGNLPLSWKDLDGTEMAKRLAPLDSSYWRRYTRVDFTLTSEQLVEHPDMIYQAVTPLSGRYHVYPHARRDLDGLMQAIRDARRSPTTPAR